MFPNGGELGSVNADHAKFVDLRFRVCELSVHEAPAGAANLAQAAKVEQGETDDLRLSYAMSWNDRRYFIMSAHARRSDKM